MSTPTPNSSFLAANQKLQKTRTDDKLEQRRWNPEEDRYAEVLDSAILRELDHDIEHSMKVLSQPSRATSQEKPFQLQSQRQPLPSKKAFFARAKSQARRRPMYTGSATVAAGEDDDKHDDQPPLVTDPRVQWPQGRPIALKQLPPRQMQVHPLKQNDMSAATPTAPSSSSTTTTSTAGAKETASASIMDVEEAARAKKVQRQQTEIVVINETKQQLSSSPAAAATKSLDLRPKSVHIVPLEGSWIHNFRPKINAENSIAKLCGYLRTKHSLRVVSHQELTELHVPKEDVELEPQTRHRFYFGIKRYWISNAYEMNFETFGDYCAHMLHRSLERKAKRRSKKGNQTNTKILYHIRLVKAQLMAVTDKLQVAQLVQENPTRTRGCPGYGMFDFDFFTIRFGETRLARELNWSSPFLQQQQQQEEEETNPQRLERLSKWYTPRPSDIVGDRYTFAKAMMIHVAITHGIAMCTEKDLEVSKSKYLIYPWTMRFLRGIVYLPEQLGSSDAAELRKLTSFELFFQEIKSWYNEMSLPRAGILVKYLDLHPVPKDLVAQYTNSLTSHQQQQRQLQPWNVTLTACFHRLVEHPVLPDEPNLFYDMIMQGTRCWDMDDEEEKENIDVHRNPTVEEVD
jgi:hypothetical protein